MSMELLYPLGIGEKPGKCSLPFSQIYPIQKSSYRVRDIGYLRKVS